MLISADHIRIYTVYTKHRWYVFLSLWEPLLFHCCPQYYSRKQVLIAIC